MLVRIPLSYTPIDSNALKEVLDRYEGLPNDRLIADFEASLCGLTKSKYAVALSSGTASIHLALKALGVEQNDEILVSTFTYVATINPILYLGAIPVFIDIEKESWNIDPVILETAIKSRLSKGIKPKAILVVHTYGMPSLMTEIMRISDQYDIPVIEDAAEGLGSKFMNNSLGTFGKIGILSFNNNKILTTYGGGVVITNDHRLAEKILFWATQSRELKAYYEHKEIGYNYRMGSINAAIGLSKINSLESLVENRRIIFRLYKQSLKNGGFNFQMERADCFSNRWLTALSFRSNMEMNDIFENLNRYGIESRRVWNPMHQQPLFSGYRYFTNDNVSDKLFSNSLCLPFCSESVLNEIENLIITPQN